MRILFTGGGTVGHVSPAIAIAEYIRAKNKDAEILFVGREGGEENRVIEKHGFNLKTLKIQGIERKICLENVRRIKNAIKAKKAAKEILTQFKPDAVIGTGGYVSWPTVSAAIKMKIPTAMHESNAIAGFATKLLSKKCTRVFLGFNGSEKEFKKKDNLTVSGNPVSDKFIYTDRREARKSLGIRDNEILISSFGGSGGSSRINNAVMNLMKKNCKRENRIVHIHISGKKYFDELTGRYEKFLKENRNCNVEAFTDNMPELLSASDIVISRCGAMTLSEISAVGVSAILIPSPNVTNNHQFKNAELLSNSGAAIMICEEEIDQKLEDAVLMLVKDYKRRKELAKRIKSFHKINSAEIICSEIEKMISL